jgi:cell wall-associated NlpC family hydrolase
MPSAGVSGLAVGLTTVGGICVVAAIRNQSPIDVIKVVLKKSPSGHSLGPAFTSVGSGVAQVVAGSVGAAAGAAAAAAASASGGALVTEARKHLGAKYVFGATGPNTFDCSGLVVYSLRKTLIPNCKRFTTFNVSSYLKGLGWTKVTPAQFASGDVIIKSGHMAIALSNSRMIAAPHTGDVVKEQDIYSKGQWWGYRPPVKTDAQIKAANSSLGKGAGMR